MPTYAKVAAKIDEVEAEMKRIGCWQDEAPTPDQLEITAPFGMDKLALEQWLQFIFIPRVRQIVAEQGEFPTTSQVSQQAFREWKMYGDDPAKDALIERLCEFDALFGSG